VPRAAPVLIRQPLAHAPLEVGQKLRTVGREVVGLVRVRVEVVKLVHRLVRKDGRVLRWRR